MLEPVNDQDGIREWKDCFFKNTITVIDPSDSRLESIKLNNQPVQFYSLNITSIDGLKGIEANVMVQVRLSLFDMTYKQFFGRTWIGPYKKVGKTDSESINYNEIVYLSTPIVDDHILVVIEVTAKSKDDDLHSVGWFAVRILGPSQDNSSKKVTLHGGTPRALLFMTEPFEKTAQLKSLPISVNYSFITKPKLSVAKKYFPENVLIGRTDPLGGVVNDGKKDYLEKPILAPQLSVIIDDLFVYLNPNVGKFENEFMRLIADDKSTWDKIKIDSSTITITERRLKIGIHNGWKYVHDPYIVHLSVDDPNQRNSSQYNSNKRLNLKSSLKVKTSEPEVATNANRLVMRNSIVINDLFESSYCAIVFQVEYVINIPIQRNLISSVKNKIVSDSKKQFETHHIMIRWGVYCPFSKSFHNELDGRVEINMFSQGNQTQNPVNRLVYQRPNTNMQDEMSARTASGKITFDIRRGNAVNPTRQHFDDNIDVEQPTQYNYKQTPTPRSMSEQSLGPDLNNRRTMPQLNDRQQKSVNDVYNAMMPRQDETLQSSQANLLMSQLISRASESQRLVGLFGGNLELYPVFNPSLHMPVLALQPGQIGGRTMSRAAYAKLHSANFPPILDRFGKPADVFDGNSYLQFDMQKEEADMLTCNQIIIQFLAFSRTLESLRYSKDDQRPTNVFFTFQFYRFPEFKTQTLNLDKIIEDYSMDPDTTPFILKAVNKDSKSSNERPGYMVSYSVDPSNLKFGEKRLFLQYLAHHAMFIDVWDGDSLHLIGTATVQLKELLRHGKEAVQSTFELDIISTEYDDDTRLNTANTYREGTPYSNDSHIKSQGLLHIRIANIGSPMVDSNDVINPTSLAPSLPFTRVVASKTSLNAFGEQILSRKIDESTNDGLISYNMSKAHHMAETFKDIHAALTAKNNRQLLDGNDENLDPLRKRKLQRMELLRKMNQSENLPPQLISNHRRIIEERNKDLKIMEFYRNQTKHDQIMNKLHEFITTEYAIYPNFGVVEFFEYVITNPYNDPQTITIIIDDPEVQVVTDSKEWRHLKLLHQIYSQVEDNMFNRQEVDTAKNEIKYPQIYLRPKETINIPLKFQTFKADNSVEIVNNYSKYNPDDLIKNLPIKYELRKANIYFRAQDKNPISILRLIIDQQPHVVNQTFRFNECEHSFLKKNIRLPSSTRVLAAHSTALISGDVRIDGTSFDQGTSQLFVRSSDPNVVCESRPVSVGEPHDIFVKAATGASPNVKKFYLAIYADQFLAVPLQIWQIFIHSLHRIDVSCTQGQISRFSLILKGTQSSRVVKCYPNAPEEMAIVPEDKFMLGSSSVQELNVGVQPFKSGVKHFYLNVVDIETHYLVHSWFINVNCKPPVVSKAFELTLPVSTSGSMATISSQKRVSFTNPYSTERIFILSTNRDDLLSFKERRIKFLANEQKTLALKFLPNPLTGFVEIYVFINNENNTNEETFALRIHYVRNN